MESSRFDPGVGDSLQRILSYRSFNTFDKYRIFLISFYKLLEPFIRGTDNPFEAIIQKRKVKAESRRDLTMDELKLLLDHLTEPQLQEILDKYSE